MLANHTRNLSSSLGVALIPLATLGLYLVTSIFYIFPSGDPQPADFILLLGFLLSLLVRGAFPKDPFGCHA
jgi:hypothetical protein